MSNTRTPKSLRDRAARLQKEGGNQDLINKLLDDANAMEREGYEAGKKSGAYKAGGAVEDPLGDFAKKKVAESDARVKKGNPKSRSMKKDPIVTMDAVKKAGFTNLRDYLNDKKGLKRRDGKAPERTKEYMAKDTLAPMRGPAVRANPMGDAARDEAVMNDEVRKRASAPFTKRELDGPSDAEVKRAKAMTAKAQEEKYGSGLKMGGKVKGYAPGGSTGKSPEMKTMPNTRPVPKDAKFGDRGAKRESPDMELMPNRRPAEDAKFGDQDAPKRKSPYMKKLKGGGDIRGYGKARGARACKIR